MEELARRQATQVRLNAELDAGALAAISDMESCLRGPPSRFTNTNKNTSGFKNGFISGNRKGHDTRSTNGGAERENLPHGDKTNTNSNSTSGNARGHTFAKKAGGGERAGTSPKLSREPLPAPASAPAVSSSGPGVRASTAMAVSRDPGRDMCDDSSNTSVYRGSGDSNATDILFAEVDEAADQLFRMEQEARRGQPRTSVSATTAMTATAGGHHARAPAAPTSRFRLSAFDKEGQKQEQQLARSAEDGDQHDRDGDSDNESVSTLIPSEGGVGPPAGLGEEATSRFWKAKLKSCQAQLEEALRAHQAGQQKAMDLTRQSASDQEQIRRLTRQLQQLQQIKTKESKAKEEESLNVASLSARVVDLERELGSSRRAARQLETDKKSLEVRLHRALEEVSKQKEAVRQARGQHKDVGQGQRLEVSRLESQCQRLERQKLELLWAFKKQLKLIDVLKRQKFHLEAARVLGFTEEDFVKTLDWDSGMSA